MLRPSLDTLPDPNVVPLDEGLELFSAVDFALGYSFPENWPLLDKRMSDFGLRRFSTNEELEIRRHYAPQESTSAQQSVESSRNTKQYGSMFPEFDAAAFGRSFADNYDMPFGTSDTQCTGEVDVTKPDFTNGKPDVSFRKSFVKEPQIYSRSNTRRLPDVPGAGAGDRDLDHQVGE